MNEESFIAALRAIATHPSARGLMDDTAVLDVGGQALVLTHDMLVEGVHFLPDDCPESVAWKLVAVNMSDLSAKGAAPLGVLMGAGLARGTEWDAAFVDGLRNALGHFGVPLLGGDTVAMPAHGPVTLGLTAIGLGPACGTPSRASARAGDTLWVSGTIGDAGLGLLMRQGGLTDGADSLARAYTHPQPNLALGQDLAPLVSAMADVSDGLLIDAQRIAQASGVEITLDLNLVPLSPAWMNCRTDDLNGRMTAATMGDDYQLLFAAAPEQTNAINAAALRCGATVTRIGRCGKGAGLTLLYDGHVAPLPSRLGYQHGT